MEVEFNQSSHANYYDQNRIEEKLGYIGKIQEIILVDFTSLHCVIFRCKWRNTFDQNNVKEYHDNGLICINSIRVWDETKEPCIFPKQRNQVFFYLDVLVRNWWFILSHDLKSNIFFIEKNVIIPSKENN